MNKNSVWGLVGILLLVAGWYHLPAVIFWINQIPLSGALVGVSSGGMSLLSLSIILPVIMALLMLFFFFGIGLFIMLAVSAMLFPVLLPVLVPVLLVMVVIWLYRQLRHQKVSKEQSQTDNAH